ncbi:hypothetical protein ACHAPE_000551 [Trichoderma viride]
MAMNVMSSSHVLGAVGDIVAQRERDLFEELVLALKEGLGPSSGLTSEDVDVDSLMEMMRAYDGGDMQWSKYAFGDASRGYTRNLVDEGNGKGSPIHDHGNAHCLMKILRGDLTETRYAFPNDDEPEEQMTVISEKTYRENQVTYMADDLGLHRVSNRGSDFAVSLHLYTPPNVAKKGCHIFDEKTGRRSHVPGCTYFSAYGRVLKE